MSSGAFQNFLHLTTGLPGGFTAGGGGTIPAALIASLAGVGALTGNVSGALALVAVMAGQGGINGGLAGGVEPIAAGLFLPPGRGRGLAFTTSGRVSLGRARRPGTVRASGPRRPTRP